MHISFGAMYGEQNTKPEILVVIFCFGYNFINLYNPFYAIYEMLKGLILYQWKSIIQINQT